MPRFQNFILSAWFIGSACVSSGADWPRLLGPSHDGTSPETGLIERFPAAGLRIAWEMPIANGLGGPAIAGGKIVVFHRPDGRETVECRDSANGKILWKHAYDAPYQPQYGGGTGPRTSPVIVEGRVFVFGITGKLHALDLATGKVLWLRDCAGEFAMRPAFFGYGSTPLVIGDRLVVQIGGALNGTPVNSIALDTATGKLLWAVEHEWGASYASSIPATIHGRECVLIFAGGKSRPPTGGLLVVDAKDGKVLAAVPHRAEVTESVSVSSPVLASSADGKPVLVFVSESYTLGGLCVEIAKDFSTKIAWQAPRFGMYWMTPIVREGSLIGFAGQNERTTDLVCQDIATGRELWRDDLAGKFGRASLLSTPQWVLCLGEFGDLAWLRITRDGVKVEARTKLFDAPETWTPPALSAGLLYVQQNEPSREGVGARLICYDLRAK